MSPSSSAGASAVLPEHCFYCFEVIDAALRHASRKGAANGDAEAEVTFPNEEDK
jgi:hypothetical protein